MSFNVIFLPYEGFTPNWLINFAFQMTIMTFNTYLMFSYIILSTMLLNQACLATDVAIHDTQKLNLVLNDENPAALILGRTLINKKMRKAWTRTLEMMDWHAKIQKLMIFNFMMEFLLLSFVFCMCLYVIESDVFGSFFIVSVMGVYLSQLFLYCWMGSRIHSKAQRLTASIYDVNWNLMTVKQRKDFLLIFMNVQNVKHLNGVFNELSMETFKKVSKFV